MCVINMNIKLKKSENWLLPILRQTDDGIPFSKYSTHTQFMTQGNI